MGEIGVFRFSFKGGYFGAGEVFGVWLESSRRLRISYSCLSSRDLLIRHLTVSDSCGVMEVSWSFFIVSCEKYL